MIKLLKDNIPIFMGRTIPILCDCNIKIERVLVEIIGFLYDSELKIAESILDIQAFMKDIIVFWDRSTTDLFLTSEDFDVLEDRKKYFQFLKEGEVIKLPKIKLWCADEVYKAQDNNPELMEEFKNVNMVILGPINKINPIIFNQIINMFPTTVNVIYGDEKLESPENNNYHYRYLTNSNCSIDVPYFEGRYIGEKRVNSVIDKLRKTNSKFNDLSVSVIKVFETDDIDIGDIVSYMEDDDNLVIVPDRLFDTINSLLYDQINVESSLDLKVGQKLYLVKSFLVDKRMTKLHKQFVIDPLTEIFVTKVNKKHHTRNSIYCSIDFQVKVNDQLILVEDALIDWTHYLLQFKKDYHPENEEEYNVIDYKMLQLDTNRWTPDVLKVVPFKVITSEYAKYKPHDRIIIYLESVDSWMLEKHTTNLYNYLSHMNKEAVIHKSFMFTNLEEI